MLFKIVGWTFFGLNAIVAIGGIFGEIENDKATRGLQILYAMAQCIFLYYVLMRG